MMPTMIIIVVVIIIIRTRLCQVYACYDRRLNVVAKVDMICLWVGIVVAGVVVVVVIGIAHIDHNDFFCLYIHFYPPALL